MEKTSDQWNLIVLLTQTAATLAGPDANFDDDKAIEAHVSNALKIVEAASAVTIRVATQRPRLFERGTK